MRLPASCPPSAPAGTLKRLRRVPPPGQTAPPGLAGQIRAVPPAGAGQSRPRRGRWAWPLLLRLAEHLPAPLAPPAPVPGGGAPARARAATHWPAPAAARRPGGGGRGCYEDEGVRSGDGVPPAGRRGALDVPAVPAKAAACPSWCYTALSNRPEARKCSLQERRRRLRPHQVAVRLVDEERGRPGLLAPGQGSLQNEKKNQSFKTARRAKQEAKKQGGLGSPGPGMPSRPHWRQCP